ncbi:MAG: DNA mismatch repair endonuclease MutL [Thioalkalivibrionaceae bacterium]
MSIQRLPPQLINQIAAGEVVERPASVVKELLENAIDAGAGRVDVRLEGGGLQTIAVTDDGKGIARDELGLALARHATSKISSFDDFSSLTSFGFRGEALPSIASVARLELRSSADDSGAGWRILSAGDDQHSEPEPTSHRRGTTVEVRDLFFRVPARRKFLRTERTEAAHCEDVLRRIALAHPSLELTVSIDQRREWCWSPCDDWQTRVRQVLGHEWFADALAIDQALESEGLHLRALLARPNKARAQADRQYWYVNRRPVQDRGLAAAVRRAYRDVLYGGRHPVFYAAIELPAGAVDVNAHPAKTEVRFREPGPVHDFVFHAMDKALALTRPQSDSQSVRAVAAPRPVRDRPEGQAGPADFSNAGASGERYREYPGVAGGAATNESAAALSWPQSEASSPEGRGIAENRGGYRGGFAAESSSTALSSASFVTSTSSAGRGASAGRWAAAAAQRGLRWTDAFVSLERAQRGAFNDEARGAIDDASAQGTTPCSHDGARDDSAVGRVQAYDAAVADLGRSDLESQAATSALLPEAHPLGRAVGQIAGTFLLAENAHGLVVVDLHAAHERVRYESLKASLRQGHLRSQPLLWPVEIPAALDVGDVVRQQHALLARLGFEFEWSDEKRVDAGDMDATVLRCSAVPADLAGRDDEALVLGVLEQLMADAPAAAEADVLRMLDDLLASKACRGAWHAGDRLTPEQQEGLLRALEKTPRADQCNHGRPTWVQLDLQALDALFLRGR